MCSINKERSIAMLLGNSQPTQKKKPLGIYVHVPFCRSKCEYCDFYSIPGARSGELMGHDNGVLFAPEDLRMVKDGPAERRRFIDIEISQTSPAYYYALQRYNRALKQRNEVLRAAAMQPAMADTLAVSSVLLSVAAALLTALAIFSSALSVAVTVPPFALL